MEESVRTVGECTSAGMISLWIRASLDAGASPPNDLPLHLNMKPHFSRARYIGHSANSSGFMSMGRAGNGVQCVEPMLSQHSGFLESFRCKAELQCRSPCCKSLDALRIANWSVIRV